MTFYTSASVECGIFVKYQMCSPRLVAKYRNGSDQKLDDKNSNQ